MAINIQNIWNNNNVRKTVKTAGLGLAGIVALSQINNYVHEQRHDITDPKTKNEIEVRYKEKTADSTPFNPFNNAEHTKEKLIEWNNGVKTKYFNNNTNNGTLEKVIIGGKTYNSENKLDETIMRKATERYETLKPLAIKARNEEAICKLSGYANNCDK